MPERVGPQRRWLRSLALAAALILLVGCSRGGEPSAAGSPAGADGAVSWSAEALGREAQRAPSAVIVVNSAPGVGVNRLAFGVFDRTGQPVTTAADAHVKLFSLEGDRGTLVSEHALRRSALALDGTSHQHTDGTQHLHEGPDIAMYTAVVELTRPEFWGADVTWSLDGRPQRQRVRFFVHPATPEPAIGAPAPRTVQRTLRDGVPLAELDTSAVPQPALHEQTIAEAVTSGRVSVIAFATPAFCQTRFCGPVVEAVVVPLAERYRDRVNVLHIEPFDVPAARRGSLQPVPAVSEWGLQSEPWVFVVGKDGRVTAKFEGVMGLDEVVEAVDRALASS